MDNNVIDDNLIINDNNINDISLLYILSNGNPGALTVLLQIAKEKEKEIDLMKNFFIKIYQYQITGSRLWYIYKNECNKNINELLNKDLTSFTNEYFWEKFEKHI